MKKNRASKRKLKQLSLNDERALLKSILENASKKVDKWPEWKRSPENNRAREQLSKVKKKDNA